MLHYVGVKYVSLLTIRGSSHPCVNDNKPVVTYSTDLIIDELYSQRAKPIDEGVNLYKLFQNFSNNTSDIKRKKQQQELRYNT